MFRIIHSPHLAQRPTPHPGLIHYSVPDDPQAAMSQRIILSGVRSPISQEDLPTIPNSRNNGPTLLDKVRMSFSEAELIHGLLLRIPEEAFGSTGMELGLTTEELIGWGANKNQNIKFSCCIFVSMGLQGRLYVGDFTDNTQVRRLDSCARFCCLQARL